MLVLIVDDTDGKLISSDIQECLMNTKHLCTCLKRRLGANLSLK